MISLAIPRRYILSPCQQTQVVYQPKQFLVPSVVNQPIKQVLGPTIITVNLSLSEFENSTQVTFFPCVCKSITQLINTAYFVVIHAIMLYFSVVHLSLNYRIPEAMLGAFLRDLNGVLERAVTVLTNHTTLMKWTHLKSPDTSGNVLH